MNLDLPPLHPALVHFPIALVTISFIADLLGRITNRRSFVSTAWWTLCAGTIAAIIAIPLGYSDMNRAMLDEHTHGLVDVHLKIGWILFAVLAIVTLWRWWYRRQPNRNPGAGYMAVAFLVVCLTLFQGWYGGEMVFSHGAGVAAADQGTQSAERAQRTLDRVNVTLTKLPGFGEGSDHHHHEVNEAAGAEKKHDQK